MILLPALLLFLWGEPSRCLEEGGGFEFNGDIRHFAVANDTVYIVTEEELHHLNHDLTLVQSLTQRGIVTGGPDPRTEHFDRVSERHKGNATLRVNVLLPFVKDNNLISCGVVDNECGYCELLDPKDISNVVYKEDILVGPPWSSSASISFLVNVEKTPTQTETFILTAVQQDEDKSTTTRCSTGTDAVNLFNTNNKQEGEIFCNRGDSSVPFIRLDGNVEFVDGFQINSVIYLFSNLPSKDNSNKVRLIWLEAKSGKSHTLKSLRGATLSISDGGAGSRLLASSVIPGGQPVLWSGVFSVDGGQTNTELVLFDISPDLTGGTDEDPDFCFTCGTGRQTQTTLKQEKVLFRQNYMTSVLAVRQKAWTVFFIGTEDGQLIKLAVDKNYDTTCPRVLYSANDDRRVFPRIHLDEVDRKHVYVPFQNQIKRVPVSNCSTYTTLQECWSAHDPYCVWCSSKRSCTFEDDCQGLDWLSIPNESQQKMVSYKVVKDNSAQIKLKIQTHLTLGQDARSSFTCQFSANSSHFCRRDSPPPQFPQCTCIVSVHTLPAKGLEATVTIKFGTMQLSEQLKLTNCTRIKGPPTSVLCRQCIEAGCDWSPTGCSWATAKVMKDSVCRMQKSGINFHKPEIVSITPSVVSLYGRNHAVLSGSNLNNVTRVRMQNKECTTQESPVWSNTGASLTFHIPSTDIKGVVKVCAVLPDGSCHGNAKITYKPFPSCTAVSPSSSWASGKRKITLIGSYLEFVEGVVHSHALQNVKTPRNSHFQNLTYDTPAAGKTGSFTSDVFLRVANETLACSSTITYYPDPEFTSFTSTRMGDDVRITIEKKADKLDMTVAELSVWGIHEGKQYPCIMEAKATSGETDYFGCEIQRTTNATFQQLMMMYGGKTVTLGHLSFTSSLSSVHNVLLTLRILLIPCVISVLVIICCWQRKLTAEMNSL